VKLGGEMVPPSEKSHEWPRDATEAIAIAAQQAVDAGDPFLAGSLWAMARRSLPGDADDAAIAAVLDKLPYTLRGIPELDAIGKRAKANLETLTGPLPCTKKTGQAADLVRVDCATYPLALSLRIGEGLKELPRLQPPKGEEAAVCSAWRALDRFLAAADERRYEPDKFTAALRDLRAHGKVGDAASLLANHRHAQHCTPQIVDHARALARENKLGIYVRADLLSVAVLCGKPGELEADFAVLDELTGLHALPHRSFELTSFAANLAKAGHPRALATMIKKSGFLDRWRRVSPDLGVLMLLLHHAGSVIAGVELDKEGSLPAYQLLCSTFPTAQRSTACNTIGVLRTGGSSDSRAAAEQALQQFIDTAAALLQGERQRQQGKAP
jgi:hypothetical protein